MAYQSKTYALSDEVIAWLVTLKDDYGSVNKGLLAVIALQQVDDDVARSKAVNVLPSADIFEPVSDNRPKNCFCKHCGGRFAGAKFSTICPDCKGSGHTLPPAECPRCTEATAI